MCMEATTENESLVFSSWCPAVHSFTLCEAGQVLWHHMFTNPSKNKDESTVLLPARAMRLFPFCAGPSPAVRGEAERLCVCQVPLSWSLSRTCLALVSYSRIVFQKQRTIRIEQTKEGPEEANQPSAPHSPTEALKHSFGLFYSQALDSCQGCVWLS